MIAKAQPDRRHVVSAETAATMTGMLEAVVLKGTAKHAKLGTLRAAVSFPSAEGAFSDERIREALRALGLANLEGRLEDVGQWEQELSPHEQQRLAVARVLLHEPDWLFLDKVTSSLDEETERRVHDLLAAPWLGERGRAAFYRQIAQADQRHTDEIEPLYPSIDLPTIVVWGAQDRWIPADRAQRLAALVPGAELVLLPDAGHLVQVDAPAALTATLQRWLLRCR